MSVGQHHSADEGRLRHLFAEAERSARQAADALLHGLPAALPQFEDDVRILIAHCHQCPDPFQALDVARVLRALMDDLDAGVYSHGSLTEWAFAEVRLQAMASRLARLLRDQCEHAAERALVAIALLHLRALEEHPRYHQIIGEMSRVTDSGRPDRPVALTEEFLGLARRDASLPVTPPRHG